MVPAQDCRQCGRCCEKWGWDQNGVVEDIIPWIQKNRQDILQHVGLTLANGTRVSGAGITERDLDKVTRIHYWTDPEGKVMTRCPFYRQAGDGKVYCGIHDTKPQVCIGFAPWNEVIRDYALNCPACRVTSP